MRAMYSRSTFILAVLLLVTTASARVFTPFSFRDHPLRTLPHLAGKTLSPPVIVNKYYNFRGGHQHTKHEIFAPGAGSLTRYPAETSYGKNLDVLIPPSSTDYLPGKYVEIHLNGPARVIAVVTANGAGRKEFEKTLPKTSGIPKGWKPSTGVFSDQSAVGDVHGPHGRQFRLPWFGLALERNFDGSTPVILPFPSKIRIGGNPGYRYTIFFAKVDRKLSSVPKRLPYPSPPGSIWNPLTSTMVDTRRDPPRPNRRCPSWLHDMYVTRSRSSADARKTGEPHYWRTWHGMIDPYYWCYFRHEHGSYPGPGYRSLFGYTAWKTPDRHTSSGRQDESHNGFKIFSFPIKGDAQKRVAVITVHMHLSLARRFSERRHTIIFAILKPTNNPKVWKTVVELHMKADFGAAFLSLANGLDIPASAHDARILAQNLANRKRFGRRFNLMNLSNFPKSLDRTYRIKGRLPQDRESVLRGMYERWVGTVNTCIREKTTHRNMKGFEFDVRNAASAMKSKTGNRQRDLQWLSGTSTARGLTIQRETVFDASLCKLNGFSTRMLNKKSGHFYTDPYFTKVVKGPSRNAVRQFIAPGLHPVTFRIGTVFPCERWITNSLCNREPYAKNVLPFDSVEDAIDQKRN